MYIEPIIYVCVNQDNYNSANSIVYTVASFRVRISMQDSNFLIYSWRRGKGKPVSWETANSFWIAKESGYRNYIERQKVIFHTERH